MDPNSVSLYAPKKYQGINLIINHDYKKEKVPRVSEGEFNEYVDGFENLQTNEWSDEEDQFHDSEFEDFLTTSQLDKESLGNLITHPKSNENMLMEKCVQLYISLVSTAVSATYFFGSIISIGLSEFIKYLSPPDWVVVKYSCSIKNIEKKLKESDLLELNGFRCNFKELILPIINSMDEKSFQSKHSSFLLALRKALASQPYLQELNKHLLKKTCDPVVPKLLELCRVRFEEGNFYDNLDTLMDDIGITGPDKLLKKDFAIIEQVKPELKISLFEVQLKKLFGHINFNFDPHLQGNIAYINDILNMGNNKQVNLIRMGTPTIEGCSTENAKIIEEFRGYLYDCVVKKKIHLYISLQNDIIKSFFTGDIGGDETGRNKVIKGLQTEFPNTFFVVVLAHDSIFYKQVTKDGKVRDPQNSKKFIKEFTQELFGNNTGFYFPVSWKRDPIFNNKVEKLLQFVLNVYFDNKEILNRQEKQDFIQIFYANLSLFLIDFSRADNANITCKDGIDRAGIVNSMLLKLVMTIEGHVDTDESQRKHRVLTHAAAFWTKSQAIINKPTGDTSNGRRERLLSADAVMNKTKDSFMENLKVNSIREFLDKTCSAA